jgi:hypothetical protein
MISTREHDVILDSKCSFCNNWNRELSISCTVLDRENGFGFGHNGQNRPGEGNRIENAISTEKPETEELIVAARQNFNARS